MAVYGYVRVSSTDQNEDRQMDALRENNVEIKNIYMDKQSGKNFDRPKYKKLVRKQRGSDLIYNIVTFSHALLKFATVYARIYLYH